MGSGSESATVAEMVYHVAMTDKAFRATDFNQDGGPGDDIGFVIAAITVFKNAESEGSNIFDASQILIITHWPVSYVSRFFSAMLFFHTSLKCYFNIRSELLNQGEVKMTGYWPSCGYS